MPTRKHIEPGTKIGLKLTAAERKLILDDLMCLDDSYAEVIKATPADQPVEFTLDDWDGLGGFIAAEANHTQDRKAGKKLDAIFNKVQKILDTYTDEEPLKTLKIEDARKAKHPQGNVAGVAKLKKDKTEKPKASTTAATVFQFKITLKEIEPLIWRRIQVKDCTLDKLHEYIQTAMGWTNSHLHQFEIKGERYGDPELLLEDYGDDQEVVNSLETKINQIVPKNGKPFRFAYEYDFGDDWIHEILFEGCPKAEKGTRYPVCLEGKRACPPEDVGGPYGYQEYLEALADAKHERHEEFMEWQGRFAPEKFDAKAVTKAMQKGLPNWREME